MSREVEVRRVSVKTLIIGVILMILFNAFYFIACSETFMSIGVAGWQGSTYGRSPMASPYSADWGRFFFAMTSISLVLIVTTIVNMVKPIFHKRDIAVVCMMLMIAGFLTSGGWSNAYSTCPPYLFEYGWGYFSPTRMPAEEDVARLQMFLADIMQCGADKEYWQMVMSTWWAPIRWDYIMPMIIWGSTLLSVLGLLGIFIALIVRRLYVDVEALTFPIANLTNEMIETTQPKNGKLGFTGKFFLIGFLIQFLWIIIGNLPWDIYSYYAWGERAPWGTARGRFGDFHIFPVYDATLLALLPWVNLNIIAEPWLIGWGALLPLEVLFGYLIGYLVFMVILPVAYTAAGIWEPMPAGRPGYIVYMHYWYSGWGPTLNLEWVYMGMLLAFAIVPIVRNLGTMGPIFKAFIGKEPPEDVDPEKPLPYKIALWGLIASIILYVALVAVANVIPIWSLLFILLTALMLFGGLRLLAETGGYLGLSWCHAFPGPCYPQVITGILLASLTGVIGVESKASMMTMAFVGYSLNMLQAGTAEAAGYTTLESFKLAKLSGIDLRDVAMIAIFTVVVTLFMHGFLTFIYHHIFPIDKWAGAVYAWLGAGLFFNLYQKNIAVGVPYWPDRGRYLVLVEEPGPVDCVTKLVIGAVIIVALTYGRERFPWLRISAAGLLLGLMSNGKFWVPFLIGTIFKYLTLRIGGVRLFEEKVKPIMVGFLFGWALAVMIHFIVYAPAWVMHIYELV